jgi:hypothetical protein
MDYITVNKQFHTIYAIAQQPIYTDYRIKYGK